MTRPPPFDARHHALFLDFDGVLVDLAETPDAIRVPPGLPRLLQRLGEATGGALALVSGRQVAELQRHLDGPACLMVGCHGAEQARGRGPVETALTVEGAAVARITARLDEAATAHPALLVERKPSGAVLHYRRDPELEAEAHAIARAAIEDEEGFHIHPAKMAFELRPDGASKDASLRLLLEEPPFAGRTPVYLGDDTTDEPALALVRARGGISIKVGEGDSAAAYRLAGPEEVHDWLARGLGSAAERGDS